jgi:hypothetical protein
MIGVASFTKWMIFILIAIFLVFAAMRELEVGIFSPKRPLNLPANAIWIDAPPLPLTFAHGWWLGCEKQDAESDRCILVGHNDRASGGDGKNRVVTNEPYLSCKTLRALATDTIALREPTSSENMWISEFDDNKKWVDMAPVAFLQNGDILAPATEISQCAKLLKANAKTPASQ